MAFAWAAGICAGGGWVPSPSNLRGLNAWIACEGGTGHNNPMNTTESCCGGTNFNSVGVKSYPNPALGITATVRTLRNGRYPAIVGALRRGNLGAALRSDSQVASNMHTWGTNLGCIQSRLGGSLSPTPPAAGAGSSSGGGPSMAQKAAVIVGAGTVGTLGVAVLVLVVLGVVGFVLLRKRGG